MNNEILQLAKVLAISTECWQPGQEEAEVVKEAVRRIEHLKSENIRLRNKVEQYRLDYLESESKRAALEKAALHLLSVTPVPDCQNIHHLKRQRHEHGEPCKAEAEWLEARESLIRATRRG